jgi:hypothetical protein
VRPPAAGEAAAADDLAGERVAGEADANDEPLRVFVFAGVRFATFGRVQEKSSTPRSRLARIHLQKLLTPRIGTRKKE